MRLINKLIKYMLITCLLLNSSIMFFTQAEDEETDSWPKEVLVLDGLGIMDRDGALYDTVPRGEFARIIARMLNSNNTWDGGEVTSFYDDVAANSRDAASIVTLTKLGIVIGDGKSFYPDREITYEEVLVILLRALGYELYARQKGAYPTGYYIAAAETGISKQSGNMGQAATRRLIATLIYNGLNAGIMEQVTFGNRAEFIISKNKTFLSEKLEILKGEGIVTATHYTKLLIPDSNLKENEIQINDDKILKIVNEDILSKDLLGYYIEYYYKEIDGSDCDELIFCLPNESRNNTINVKARNIVSYINNQFIYIDDITGKSKTLNISKDVKIIYIEGEKGFKQTYVFKDSLQ